MRRPEQTSRLGARRAAPRKGMEGRGPSAMGLHTGISNKKHAWESLMPLFLQQLSVGIYPVSGMRETADFLMGMMCSKQDK